MYDRRPTDFSHSNTSFLLALLVLCSLVVWAFLAASGLTAPAAKAQSGNIPMCSFDGAYNVPLITGDSRWNKNSAILTIELDGFKSAIIAWNQQDLMLYTRKNSSGVVRVYIKGNSQVYGSNYNNGNIQTPVQWGPAEYGLGNYTVGCMSVYGTPQYGIHNPETNNIDQTTQADFAATVLSATGWDINKNIDQSVTLPETDNESCAWWNFSCWFGTFNPKDLLDVEGLQKKLGVFYQAPAFLLDFVNSFNPLSYVDVNRYRCRAYPHDNYCDIDFPVPFQGGEEKHVTLNAGEWRNTLSGIPMIDFMFTVVGLGIIISLSNRLYHTYLSIVEDKK